ncbi:hypothetical protein [Sulfitobacter albidus]|uniref:hypothetical protein n=1 Tax=Sulfitobacter albidus TaxID=2829501 RepID=UPI0020C85EAB|nr:hypothetical protein [Sulfitobacter albidus]
MRGGITTLDWDALSADSLTAALAQVTALPRPTPVRDTMHGATRTAEIVHEMRAAR